MCLHPHTLENRKKRPLELTLSVSFCLASKVLLRSAMSAMFNFFGFSLHLQSPGKKTQRPKSLQLVDSRLTPFHSPSPLQSTVLSPPPLTPKAMRTLSSPSLQTDGLMASVPPPPPPKNKPYESSQRNSAEIAPPLPVRRDAKAPPPPPPKARKSSILSSEPGSQ